MVLRGKEDSMTQQAFVKKQLTDGRVEVVVHRQSACSHNCADCAGCGSMIHQDNVTVVAENALGAKVGQTVTVESATGKVLSVAALIYLLPFVGLFGAYLLLGRYSEGVAALGAVVSFLVMLLAVCIPLDRHLKRKNTMTFRVIAVGES